MPEQIADKKCANALCGCKPELGSDFCGLHCAQERDETDCGCGHAECMAKAFQEAAT
jgi:hypothetical protein